MIYKTGRRIELMHPTLGTTRFTYDHAGNLIARTTANKDSIVYEYELNRLKCIKYPRYPENNVTYTYGTSTDNSNFNRKGRLVYMEDGSGGQEFKYGKMGSVPVLTPSAVLWSTIFTMTTSIYWIRHRVPLWVPTARKPTTAW